MTTAPAPASSRIGLIVPSSNTTMETELPELFRRQGEATGHRYTFHSARAAMKQVSRDELLAMVVRAAECATAVSDADVDVIAVVIRLRGVSAATGVHSEDAADRDPEREDA